MRDNFPRSLDLVLAHEGGFVNHPQDPGGATNLGITIGTLSDHLGRPANVADVKGITKVVASKIYKTNYWDRARCDDLPIGLDYAVFDFAVNSGVSRAVRTLQRVLGVKEDGVIGAKTMSAITPDTASIIYKFCQARMTFLRGLKHWRTFGKGWTIRVEAVQEVGQDMARGGGYTSTPPIPPETGREPAREEDQKLTVTLNDPKVLATVGTVVTGALTAGAGNGPMAYAIAGVLILAAIAGILLIVRRKW